MSDDKPNKPNLLKSTFVVSSMTVISRITGLLRDLIYAQVFGAAAGLDAFLVAFKVPNFLRRLFAEGAFSQAFVPVLSEYRQKRSQDEVQVFVNRMAGSLLVTLFWVTVLAVLIAPWLIWIFAPGFVIGDATRYQLAGAMLRITFPYLFFISLTAFLGGILNSYGKFSVPAFTPNILNLTLIAAAIFVSPYFSNPVEALAWGVFFAGAAQLLFQFPFVIKLGLLPRPQLMWKDAGVKRVLKLMLPAVLGVSVAQISLLIDTLFASFLRQGSISWLYYSDRFTSFPLGVFGVAIATVVLPHLSRKYADKSSHEFSSTLDWALKYVLLIALPSAIGIILLARPILTTLLEYGKFTTFDVIMAGRSLVAFAVGVPAFMLVKVLASGFYSRQDIRTPVKIAITVLICNIFLAVILIFPLAHAGLALATSLTSTLNAGLLFFTLIRRRIYKPRKEWKMYFLRVILANGLMGLFIWYFTSPLSMWFAWHWKARAWHLLILCGGAIVIYFACLSLSGLKWREFLAKG